MKSSFSNRTINYLSRHYFDFIDRLTTYYAYLKSRIQDVQLGVQCKFVGDISFFVGNGGKLIIGNNCRFISNHTRNRIGLNHKCMLTTTPAYENSTCELIIGDNCGFSGVSIWCFKKIIFGNNVRVGANCLIMDGDAHFDDERTSPPEPIIIEDNVFIGANVVVKKGVTIGKNSVIGMNSVVTKNIPANSVAVGIPCKVIRQLK